MEDSSAAGLVSAANCAATASGPGTWFCQTAASAMEPWKYSHSGGLLSVVRPAPTSAKSPRLVLAGAGSVKVCPLPVATSLPSRYRARPGITTAWCQAPSLTVAAEVIAPVSEVFTLVVVMAFRPSRWPDESIHSSGTASASLTHWLLEFTCSHDVWPGMTPLIPASTPDVELVLNQTLIPTLFSVVFALVVPSPDSTRPVSAICWQVSSVVPVHHAPSSGTQELDPSNPVAVTPEIGPATPGVVLISAAGGSSVVSSSTGIWLSAAVEPDGSLSR